MRAIEGDLAGDIGVDGADALIGFVEASVATDAAELARCRDTVRNELGDAILVDAAAVAAAFQMMNRLANATGTPLDDNLVDMTAGARAELQLDNYTSAPNGGHQ